jgi:hypothetical protein
MSCLSQKSYGSFTISTRPPTKGTGREGPATSLPVALTLQHRCRALRYAERSNCTLSYPHQSLDAWSVRGSPIVGVCADPKPQHGVACHYPDFCAVQNCCNKFNKGNTICSHLFRANLNCSLRRYATQHVKKASNTCGSVTSPTIPRALSIALPL